MEANSDLLAPSPAAAHPLGEISDLAALDDLARALVTSSFDPIVVADHGMRVLYWSPGAERLLGWPAGEIVGEPILKIVPPEHHSEVVHLKRKAEDPGGVEGFLTKHLHKEGDLVDLRINACCWHAPQGPVRGYVLVYRDLSTQAQAEDRHIFQEKMVTLGQLAAGLAHEIRNPLNAAGLQLLLLRRRLDKHLPSESAELTRIVRVVEEEIDRLERLIEEFLDLARPSDLEFEKQDLVPIVQDIVGFLQPRAEDQKVGVQESHRSSRLLVRVDKDRIRQVLMNLILNALEAMPEGGLLRVETRRTKEMARIRVSDSGPGIPKGEMKKVFEMFYTTRGSSGTGLGLFVARKILEEHGGTITCESRVGKGTTFVLDLPCLSEAPGAGASAQTAPSAGTGAGAGAEPAQE